jgi:hypothetical protein
MNAPVRRNARGHLLPGARLNPGGRPVSAVTELRARYSRRVPEVFDRLMEMATDNSQPPMVQLAAIRLALDHLLGRPQISVDTVTTRINVAELYRNAMIRANAGRGASEINGSASEKEIQ